MADEIDRFFENFIGRVDKAERDVLVNVTRVAYKAIMRDWPVWSGYSKANNRISVTGETIGVVRPAKRVLKPGAHVGQAAATEASELSKLDGLGLNKTQRPRIIVLGNAVSYAADVGQETGRGLAIYQNAVNEAKLTIKGV